MGNSVEREASIEEGVNKLDKLEAELVEQKKQNDKLRFHIVILANTLGECVECSAKYGEEHDADCEIGNAIAGHANIIHEVEVERDEWKRKYLRLFWNRFPFE